MKRFAAGAVTSAILIAFLIAAGMRSRGATADSPDKCLDQMFEAMKLGDVAAYLGCFTGSLRERLERDARQQTNAKFSVYIKELVAPIKGRAVRIDVDAAGPDNARLLVDRVYDGRAWELQAYRLRRETGRWRIYEIEKTELHEPPVPYGTPAIPVPDDASQTDDSVSARSDIMPRDRGRQ